MMIDTDALLNSDMDGAGQDSAHADQDAGAFLSKKLNGRSPITDRIYLDVDGSPLSRRRHLEVALRHNLREIVAERGPYGGIDIQRTPSNYILWGPDTSYEAMMTAEIIVNSADTGGKKLRRDALWGIELIFTALPKTDGDLRAYFEDCTRWAAEEFNVPVLSSIVHLDQGAPHCHVLLVPLIGGKMNGGKVYGNKPKMVARLTSFYESVGKRYGLNRPQPTQKLPQTVRMGMLQRLADVLSDVHHLTGQQIKALLKPFQADPLPLAEIFGVINGGRRSELKFG